MILQTKVHVTMYSWTRYGTRWEGTHKGSGYCEDQGYEQYLVKDWMLGRFRIWRKVLDKEIVPIWAVAQQSFLGGTGWKSKFASYICGELEKDEKGEE